MDDERFDRLARLLRDRLTRRGVAGVVIGSVAALPLREAVAGRRAGGGKRRKPGTRGASAQRQADCAARCKDLFPPGKRRGQCVSDGAHGRGPCAEPVCTLRCANDNTCCDEPGFGCCADTCTKLDDDGACPPPICTNPSTCTSDDQCCGTDLCQCGIPHVCVQFKSLGTGACCTSDDECIAPLLCVATGNGTGVCCHPAFPETCVCQNC